MRKLFDFRCSACDTIEEYFVDVEKSGNPRCKCGSETTKVIRPIRFDLEGISGDFPTAADKWVQKRKQKIALERKQNQDNP